MKGKSKLNIGTLYEVARKRITDLRDDYNFISHFLAWMSYIILVAKPSELRQFLSHEQTGFSDGGQDGVANIVGHRGVRGVVLEITDLFFKLETLVLDELKYIITEISTAQARGLTSTGCPIYSWAWIVLILIWLLNGCSTIFASWFYQIESRPGKIGQTVEYPNKIQINPTQPTSNGTFCKTNLYEIMSIMDLLLRRFRAFDAIPVAQR